MRIHASFPGGNIRVLSVSGDTITLAPDMRDSSIDWFYWHFCVEGAQGKTLRFVFSPSQWVGPFGAAVSRDGIEWAFSDTASPDQKSFAYTFGQAEDTVFFCHDMHYSPKRFDRAADRLGLTVFPFCRSKTGREVPAVMLGDGTEWILLTSRHHCCESTGTYVMEGMLAEYTKRPIPGTRLLAIPFMDMDGVVMGDQGKCRRPHDHNRDYADESRYPEVAAVRAFAAEHPVRWALDLHSPNHMGGRSGTCYSVCPNDRMSHAMRRFGARLAIKTREIKDCMAYEQKNDVEVGQEWNVESPGLCSFSRYFALLHGIKLAHTLETTYFGTAGNRVSQARLVTLGRAMMETLRELV